MKFSVTGVYSWSFHGQISLVLAKEFLKRTPQPMHGAPILEGNITVPEMLFLSEC